MHITSVNANQRCTSNARMAGERFAANTGKIDACSNLRTRNFGAKRALAIIFQEKIKNARESASSRDPDWEEDETLVAGCPLSSDRSRLPHMEGKEKLPAPLHPVSANYAEAWAERVLGILAALNHPAVSWVATSTFWGNFPAAAGSTSPLKGVLSGKVLITTVISMAFAPWCGYSALPARSAT
jgi:hypothetical protein